MDADKGRIARKKSLVENRPKGPLFPRYATGFDMFLQTVQSHARFRLGTLSSMEVRFISLRRSLRASGTRLQIDLLQVSLSLSYSIDPLQCTLHDVAWRGGARKRDLSTSENLGSKLNRKCKTCFNCFP
jgi:hypothetical protein